jgi:hypothetical protein
MNIVVCVKQIPDPAAPQSLDPSHNLNRSGKLILDEADTYGVEMALQLVDKAGAAKSRWSRWDRPPTSLDCATPSPWAPPRPSS